MRNLLGPNTVYIVNEIRLEDSHYVVENKLKIGEYFYISIDSATSCKILAKSGSKIKVMYFPFVTEKIKLQVVILK